MTGRLPSETEALKLLDGLPEKLIEHSKSVSKTAVEIAERIKQNGHEVDVELVRVAGLLHDLGRKKISGLGHGKAGGDILRGLGYSEALCNAVESHEDDKKSIEQFSLEAKIIYYADGITMHSCKTTLEERFRDVVERRKNAGRHAEAEIIEKGYSRCKQTEQELEKLMKT